MQILMYLITGILTTLLNISIFYFLEKQIGYQIANIIAFIASVIFAYVTNKIYVFSSKNFNFKFLIKEFTAFISSRLLTYVIDISLMIFFIEKVGINSTESKIIVNIIIVILNYVLSKCFIFKKKILKNEE